jgi:four helix bundle protein
MYYSFEDLEVWKRACKLAVRIYGILKDSRDFGLRDQMSRAAVSIASNIAEGAERNSKAEFIRFLHISKGSAAELRTQVYIAQQAAIIPDEISRELIDELTVISRQLHSLASTLKPKT